MRVYKKRNVDIYMQKSEKKEKCDKSLCIALRHKGEGKKAKQNRRNIFVRYFADDDRW